MKTDLLIFLEQLRIGSDILYLSIIADNQTDMASGPIVRELVDIMMDALNNPDKPRPEGEHMLGRMVKESVIFYTNAFATGSSLIVFYLQDMRTRIQDRHPERSETLCRIVHGILGNQHRSFPRPRERHRSTV
jgi:hypothetical protein